MPIYEYNCDNCNYSFDKLVLNKDSGVHCPLCQGEVKKLMSTFSYAVNNSLSSPVTMDAQRKMCSSCS
ncbi:MAG: zinc ribbon domain-containing protein [Desulfobacteraceae bacterium]|nr:zinc ribbon domain-containing protein [Desulfobacteraceae bacterium]